MNLTIIIKYGTLQEVVGPPTQADRFVFVPVQFSFDQEPVFLNFIQPGGYRLMDYIGDSIPLSLAQCKDEYGKVREDAWGLRKRVSVKLWAFLSEKSRML